MDAGNASDKDTGGKRNPRTPRRGVELAEVNLPICSAGKLYGLRHKPVVRSWAREVAEIIGRLNRDINAALADPGYVRKSLDRVGFIRCRSMVGWRSQPSGGPLIRRICHVGEERQGCHRARILAAQA